MVDGARGCCGKKVAAIMGGWLFSYTGITRCAFVPASLSLWLLPYQNGHLSLSLNEPASGARRVGHAKISLMVRPPCDSLRCRVPRSSNGPLERFHNTQWLIRGGPECLTTWWHGFIKHVFSHKLVLTFISPGGFKWKRSPNFWACC